MIFWMKRSLATTCWIGIDVYVECFFEVRMLGLQEMSRIEVHAQIAHHCDVLFLCIILHLNR